MIRLDFAALFALALASPATADWPERPVRLVVPYAAGGSTDLVARLIGARLSERLGGNSCWTTHRWAIIDRDRRACDTADGNSPLVVNPRCTSRSLTTSRGILSR
jgi:hypothetical protein